MTFDALSLAANGSGSAPKLLWHTVFGTGISLSAPFRQTDNLWKTTLTGKDDVTGFNCTTDITAFLSTGAEIFIQSIPDYAVPDSTAYDIYGSETFESLVNYPWRSDGRQLVWKVLNRQAGAPNPQKLLMMSRPSSILPVNSPLEEFYILNDFIIPTGTTTQTGDTATGKFIIPGHFEFKTGCHYNGSVYQNSVGDMRLDIQINGSDGTDKWQVTLDNQANGGYDIVEYWKYKESGVPILYDTPLRMHVHVKRPRDNADLVTGRIVVGVEAYGQPIKILADIQGGIQKGPENLPITRFMFNLYGSVLTPMIARCGQIQIWNRPPLLLL